MQSNAIRSMWASTLWARIQASFNFTSLPADALVSVGYPSRAARGAANRRAPAEILFGAWQGNPEERIHISIHPERFVNAREVAKALVYAAAKKDFGKRGPAIVGIHRDGNSGELIVNSTDTSDKIEAITTELGDPPSGFATLAAPGATKQPTLMHKFACPGCGLIIRKSAKWQLATIVHQECGQALISA